MIMINDRMIMITAHDLTTRREPLGAVPGFRAVCTCGESAWWLDEWQVDEWWERHLASAILAGRWPR